MSSTLLESFDAIIEIMAKIAVKLPHFQMYAELFGSNDKIQRVLCLFYKDILDVHVVMLNFFTLKSEFAISVKFANARVVSSLISTRVEATLRISLAKIQIQDCGDWR